MRIPVALRFTLIVLWTSSARAMTPSKQSSVLLPRAFQRGRRCRRRMRGLSNKATIFGFVRVSYSNDTLEEEGVSLHHRTHKPCASYFEILRRPTPRNHAVRTSRESRRGSGSLRMTRRSCWSLVVLSLAQENHRVILSRQRTVEGSQNGRQVPCASYFEILRRPAPRIHAVRTSRESQRGSGSLRVCAEIEFKKMTLHFDPQNDKLLVRKNHFT
jgi:hypothetical protein